MTLGDPKKAKILMIVAAGAVGFVVIQLLPAPAKPKQAAAPRSLPSQSEEVAIASNALLRDPFSSTLLIVKPVSKGSTDHGEIEQTPTVGKHSHMGMDDTLPEVGLSPFALADATKAKDSAVSNRAKITGLKTVIKLDATMTVQRPVAMISIGNAESAPFYKGQQPLKGMRLESVGLDGVTIVFNGHRTHLAVGGEMSL